MTNEYNKILSSINIPALLDCSSGYVDREDCSWYHHNWMLLRSLGLVSNPFWHTGFYTEQITTSMTRENSSVLVLGTADFSMPLLCHIVGIKSLEICDICKTPLNVCDEAAKLRGFSWITFQRDVFDGFERKYDMIVNDAFLTRFDCGEKRAVLKKIFDALSEKGFYITTVRKGWNGGQAVIPGPEQMEGFVDRAIQCAVRFDMDVESVKHAAGSYINKMISFPVQNKESLSELAEGLFTVKICNAIGVVGECLPTQYYQVVLQKL